VLLIEARRGADGQLRVLAVLDLDPEALAAEVKRLAERKDDAVPAVEAIDRATWFAMRRLETTGMLKLAEGSIRVLHRASELTADHAAGDQAGRASELHKGGRAVAAHGQGARHRRIPGGSFPGL